MDCKRIREYLYSYIDGQLDNQTNLLIEEHLSICPICSLEYQEEKKFDNLIRQGIPRDKAPFALKETVLTKMEESQKVKIFPFLLLRLRPVWLTISVTLLIGVIFVAVTKHRPFPIFSESISSHIKFLQGSLPIEIASSNPQEIKNWFAGKLDFAISVPDFSKKGINLLGARLCHIKGKEAAYLIYEKNGQKISVFIINIQGLIIPKAKKITLDKHVFFAKSEKGYQSLLCLKKENHMGCIFVSDLTEEELRKIII